MNICNPFKEQSTLSPSPTFYHDALSVAAILGVSFNIRDIGLPPIETCSWKGKMPVRSSLSSSSPSLLSPLSSSSPSSFWWWARCSLSHLSNLPSSHFHSKSASSSFALKETTAHKVEYSHKSLVQFSFIPFIQFTLFHSFISPNHIHHSLTHTHCHMRPNGPCPDSSELTRTSRGHLLLARGHKHDSMLNQIYSKWSNDTQMKAKNGD